MYVREVLFEIAGRSITLRCGRTEDRLNAKPTAALTPELIAEIKAHKDEIIGIMREDQRLKESGIIQSEWQVFDLAHVRFRKQDSLPPSPSPRLNRGQHDLLVPKNTDK